MDSTNYKWYIKRATVGLLTVLTAAMVLPSPILAGSKQDWKLCPKFDKLNQAISACTRIIKRRGEGRKNTGIAYNNRCTAYSKKGQYDQAIADCTKAIRFIPKYALAYQNRCRAHMLKGQYDIAIADCDEGIKLNPKASNNFFHRAYSYAAKGNLDQAIENYGEAIKLNPKSQWAYNNRGNAYRDKGEYQKALDDFEKAFRIDGNNLLALSNQGLTKERKALDIKNPMADGGWYIGQIDPKAEKELPHYIEEVRKIYRKVLASDAKGSGNEKARKLARNGLDRLSPLKLAQNLRKKGANTAVLAVLSEVMAKEPENTKAIFLTGLAFESLNNHDQAITHLKKYTVLKPSDNNGWFYLAYSIANNRPDKNQRDEVISTYSRSIAIRDTDYARNYRGVQYRDKGEYEKAIADFKRAVVLDKSSPLYLKNLAETLELAGHEAAAYERWRQLSELQAEDNQAKQFVKVAKMHILSMPWRINRCISEERSASCIKELQLELAPLKEKYKTKKMMIGVVTEEIKSGFKIREVKANTPAEREGIMPGDVITAIDGKKIKSSDEFISAVISTDGRSAVFTVERDSRKIELSIAPERLFKLPYGCGSEGSASNIDQWRVLMGLRDIGVLQHHLGQRQAAENTLRNIVSVSRWCASFASIGVVMGSKSQDGEEQLVLGYALTVLELAIVLDKQGKWQEAERLYPFTYITINPRVAKVVPLYIVKAFLEKYKHQPIVRYILAREHNAFGSPKALTEIDEYLSIRPDSSEARVLRHKILMKRHRLEDAIATLDHLLASKPEHAQALLLRARALVHNSQDDKASVDYGNYVKLKPDNDKAWLEFAELEEKRSNPKQALNHYSNAIKILRKESYIPSELASILLARGRLLLRMKLLSRALRDADELLKMDSYGADGGLLKADILDEMGKKEAAKTILDTVASSRSSRFLDEQSACESQYRHRLELVPELRCAEVFSKNGQPHRALSVLERLLAKDNNAEAYLMRGGPVTLSCRFFDLVFCHKGEMTWHHHNAPLNSAPRLCA